MESNPQKRKRTRSSSQTSRPKQVCIVHSQKSNNESFTYMSQISDCESRLQKLKDIRTQRSLLSLTSADRMKQSCDLIPDVIVEYHGYHRDCYQRFTKNLDRLSSTLNNSSAEPTNIKRPPREKHSILFNPDCIFCNKEGRIHIKRKGVWTKEDTSKFEFGGGPSLEALAKKKNDIKLLRRIENQDLFAREAHYHRSCLKKYSQDPCNWRSSNEESKNMQKQSDIAHQKAFDAVCQIIDNDVLLEKKVMKLGDLCQVYILNLQGTQFANPNYKAERLKSKLEKHDHYVLSLSFVLLEQASKGYLVYSSNIDVVSAMKSAFKLGSIGMMRSVADDLRNDIFVTFDRSGDLAWPPVVENLQSDHEVIPSKLTTFLTILISGKMVSDDKRKCLVSSIGQDICRAVTKGRWKLPKHILLSMTFRHLYRSKELTTLINRFGHCECYDFSLEVETAIAKAVDQISSLLTTQIICHPQLPSLFHSEFDNFDQLVSNLTGQGSVHTAHGIMLQEIQGPVKDHGGTVPNFQNMAKTNERSFQCNPAVELPECYITKRKCPDFAIRLTLVVRIQ